MRKFVKIFALLLMGLMFVGLLSASSLTSSWAKSPRASTGSQFFFIGKSSDGSSFTFGSGTFDLSVGSAQGTGSILTKDRINGVNFAITESLICIGPPGTPPCLILLGSVTSVTGASLAGAVVGDPVQVVIFTGSHGITVITFLLSNELFTFTGEVMIS